MQRFLTSSLKEMTLDNVSPYQRKLIFSNVKPNYSTKLYFETIEVDEEAEADSTKPVQTSQSSEELASNNNSSDEIETQIPSGISKISSTLATKTQPIRTEPKVRVMRVFKLSEEEQLTKINEKKQAELDAISKNVAFSRVIRKISSSVSVALLGIQRSSYFIFAAWLPNC